MKNNLKAKIIDIRKKKISYLKMLKYDLLNLKDIGIKKVILKRKFEIGIIIFILISKKVYLKNILLGLTNKIKDKKNVKIKKNKNMYFNEECEV